MTKRRYALLAICAVTACLISHHYSNVGKAEDNDQHVLTNAEGLTDNGTETLVEPEQTEFLTSSLEDAGTDFMWSDEEKGIFLQTATENGVREAIPTNSIIETPSGKTAALSRTEGNKYYSLIVTLEDGSQQKCDLVDIFFTALYDFKWIDENRIILEGHKNPSLNVYIIYLLEDNSFQAYYGLYFLWDNDVDTLYYAEKFPYWGTGEGTEKILDQNENVYYETRPGEKLIHTLILDETGEFLGFFTESDSQNFELMDCRTREILYEDIDVTYNTAEIELRSLTNND